MSLWLASTEPRSGGLANLSLFFVSNAVRSRGLKYPPVQPGSSQFVRFVSHFPAFRPSAFRWRPAQNRVRAPADGRGPRPFAMARCGTSAPASGSAVALHRFGTRSHLPTHVTMDRSLLPHLCASRKPLAHSQPGEKLRPQFCSLLDGSPDLGSRWESKLDTC